MYLGVSALIGDDFVLNEGGGFEDAVLMEIDADFYYKYAGVEATIISKTYNSSAYNVFTRLQGWVVLVPWFHFGPGMEYSFWTQDNPDNPGESIAVYEPAFGGAVKFMEPKKFSKGVRIGFMHGPNIGGKATVDVFFNFD
jgi:hypothetical protein